MNETLEVFPWNENFTTGIAQIDEQHQKLVQLLNKLAGSLANQSDLPALDRIFTELTEYATYHFQTEETIWQQYFQGDTREAAHKAVHDSFVAEVLKLKEEEHSKPLNEVLEDILSFLTHWLAFHILDSDKHMSKMALAVQSGMPLAEAKLKADIEMSGAMKVLIETVLSMYDTLANRTLQLMKEVIDRQKAEEKLRLAANVIENTLEAICITDAHSNVIDVNPAFYQSTQYSAAEVIGKKLGSLKSGIEDEPLATKIGEALARDGHWSGEIRNRSKSGEIYGEWLTLSAIRNEKGVVSNYVGVFSNIAHLIRQRHELEHVANHDSLTGLPNSLLLSDRLAQSMANARRNEDFLAVCYLDLDGFKPVNDIFGHAAGDLVLREIAIRLQKVVRGNDTVARLGGDEFVILIGEMKAADDYRDLLERVLLEIAQPIAIGEEEVVVNGSIGVCIFPDDNVDAQTLLEHADQAMYQAKRNGKSCYRLFDQSVAQQ